MSKERVLVVDEDLQIQRLLRAQLLARDFVVQLADRGEDALITAAEFEPDLILLAIALPGIDGVETTRRLREWTQTPIIMLNGPNHEQLTVEALDAGADDYVTKPFSMAVLLARMRAVLRRARDWVTVPAPATPLTFRNVTLDLVNRRVLLDGQPLHLTPTEYQMLRLLATHAGRVLTHRELLTRVWGPESAGDSQYLHVFISQLRRKLQSRPDGPRHILTEAGVGYQFSAEP
jgi:two-component system KDP operon response regulator KdpE